MSSTVIRGADRKKDAEKILKQPVLVLFYMDGCPHCEANRKAWEEAKKKAGVRTVEIESSATPESSGVTGFPTMTYKGKEISGQKETGDEILKELEVPVKRRGLGGTRRVRNALGGRKLRHRTLRSYISFI
jgi:glutaredoxin